MDAVLAATQADLFWLPEHVAVRDEPDVLALCDGSEVDLYNQVVRTGGPKARVPDLVDRIDRWHRGVSQWLVVPGQHRDALLDALPRRGYALDFRGDAYTLSVDADVPHGGARVVEVHDRATLRDSLEAAQRSFGIDVAHLDLDRELALCTGAAARTARFVAYAEDGTVAGSGHINRYPSLRFGFLWAGCTVPGHRGRGVYRSLLHARQRWARVHGLSHVGLYAKRDTSGPVVAAVGFTRHGPMDHWVRPARGEPQRP